MLRTSRSALLLSILFLVPLASAAPQTAPAVPEGVPAGLGAAFHAGRRAALREALGEGLVVLRGRPETRAYVRFFQDPMFWYLTGVEGPDAALVMDAATGEEILFLPRPQSAKEMWEGELWDTGDAWVGTVTGMTQVRPERGLAEFLRQRVERGARVWITTQPWLELAGSFDRAGPYNRRRAADPLDGRGSREEALRRFLADELGADVKDCNEVLFELRRVKTSEEIDALRRSCEVGVEAMKEAMRSTRAGLMEYELEGVMELVHRRLGAEGNGYYAIVGSGPNSLVLHHSRNSRRLRSGEVLLLDFGPTVNHYVCDITRTWPVDGKFTPRMRELYEAVLAAQAAGIAAAKPGVTIRDVDAACSAVLRERGFQRLMRHGACHWIGLEVHDVGAYDAPLVPGAAFTIEPGLYEPATGIGIRIEDVVVITADGCEVLTAGAPRDPEEVERLVGEVGILDWLDAGRRDPEREGSSAAGAAGSR